MATSGSPRFIVRHSNRNILIQIARSEIEGDYIVTQTGSAELVKIHGWLGGRKNTSAAYLLGLIVGYKALKEGVEDAVLDIGLKRQTMGSKLFAATKGAIDAGLKIPCDSDVMPGVDRIEGAAIVGYAKSFDDALEYERMFSDYLQRGLRPERLTEHFKEIKQKIEELGSG
jgi:large subunit ribosomal protein L18